MMTYGAHCRGFKVEGPNLTGDPGEVFVATWRWSFERTTPVLCHLDPPLPLEVPSTNVGIYDQIFGCVKPSVHYHVLSCREIFFTMDIC